MALRSTLSPTLGYTLFPTLGYGGSVSLGLLDLYPATAAYSAYDLGNKRGSVTEAEGTVVNPVQRWRRSSDDALQMFTAKDIANGTALDFVVPTDVQALYNSAMYFDGVSNYVTSTVANFRGSDQSGRITLQFASNGTSTAALFGSADTAGTSDVVVVLLNSTGEVRVLSILGGVANGVATVATFNDGGLHDVEVESDGSSWTITVDGTVQTLTVTHASNSGNWFGDLTNSDGIFSGANVRSSVDAYLAGIVRNIKVYDPTDTLVFGWDGSSNVDSGWLDTVGSNNGTVGGTPAIFTGQGYDAYLLTEYDQHDTGLSDLYGKNMYFDGVNDYVSIPPSSFNPTLDSQIVTFNAVPLANSVAGVIFSYRSTGTELIQVTQQDATTLLIQVRGSTGLIEQDTITVISGAKISGTLTFNGVTKTATLVTNQGSASVSGFGNVSAQGNLTLGATFSPLLSAFFKGTVYDVNINGTSAYDGDGNTNSNWLDTIGSNNGTVAGSPSLFQGQGVAYDLTQTTAANQPLVVSGGALTVDANGNVAPLPDGVNDFLASSLVPPSTASIFVVADASTEVSRFLYGARDSADERSHIGRNAAGLLVGGVADATLTGSAFATNTLASLVYTPTQADLYKNGGLDATAAITQTVDNVTQGYSMFAMNDAGTNGFFWPEPIAAVLVYNTDQSANRAAIEAKLSTIVTTAIS